MMAGTKIDTIVPYMEGRYKAIDLLLKRAGVKQVVEIAAGWTPRGMIMTEDDTYRYIETDQDPVEVKQKEEMVRNLLGRLPAGLHVVPFDAVTGKGLSELCELMLPQKTGVVHEGLFRYLTHEQKGKVMDNVHAMLASGGVYITPDIHTRTMMKKFSAAAPSIQEANKKHSALTGTDIEANYFVDEAEAQALFEAHGFDATHYRIGDLVKELTCMTRPGLDADILKRSAAMLSERTIWVMTPK
jgi:O-methyltransferase involved in polyketide biosynthesis